MKTFWFVLLSSLAICFSSDTAEGKQILNVSFNEMLKNLPELKQQAQTQIRGCIHCTTLQCLRTVTQSVIAVMVETGKSAYFNFVFT